MENGTYLASLLRQIPGLAPARQYEGCTNNAFHLFMFRYNPASFSGLTRAGFLKALAAEGIPRAVLVAHSMSTQVALETWRQRPEAVAGLVLGVQKFEWGNPELASMFVALAIVLALLGEFRGEAARLYLSVVPARFRSRAEVA